MPSVPSAKRSNSLAIVDGSPSCVAMPSPASVTRPTSSRDAMSGVYDETKRSSASRISSGRIVSSASLSPSSFVGCVHYVVRTSSRSGYSRRRRASASRPATDPSRTSSPTWTTTPPTMSASTSI